jgi:hypothetical protein
MILDLIEENYKTDYKTGLEILLSSLVHIYYFHGKMRKEKL